MFDDIHILRTNSAGKVLSQVKVPLSYAPARSFIERLEEMSQGESAERRVALKLPRMSFEIVSIAYDAQRQLPKLNYFTVADDNYRADKYYVGVPYTLSFQLSVYARSQDDALQVVEQILPYFAPQYTLSVKPFSDQPDIKEDIPISLTSIDFQDDFEGPVEQRRTIIYNMTFDMRVNFYGPENDAPIVREVNTNLNLIDNDDRTSFVENVQVTPSPIDVSPDSDYGFSVLINDNDFTSET
jgi:hypothetical protein